MSVCSATYAMEKSCVSSATWTMTLDCRHPDQNERIAEKPAMTRPASSAPDPRKATTTGWSLCVSGGGKARRALRQQRPRVEDAVRAQPSLRDDGDPRTEY